MRLKVSSAKRRPFCLGLNVLRHTCHDGVIKWKHFPHYWSFVRGIHRSPVNSPHKGQWRGALVFSLICAWTNDCASNRDAGDLRRHRAHYDVTVIVFFWQSVPISYCRLPFPSSVAIRRRFSGLQPKCSCSVPYTGHGIGRSGHVRIWHQFSGHCACICGLVYTFPITDIFSTMHQHIMVETKWPRFCRQHFQTIFLNENGHILM